jgi:hypothetical protein
MFDDDDDFYFLRLEHRLFHLSIREAAELVAIDMWASGEFADIEEPDGWEGNARDPMIAVLLDKEIKDFESKIFDAVNSGKLKAKNIIRDFDENLIATRPRIRYSDLDAWLEGHGYSPGDIFAEWAQDEVEIEGKLEEEFDYLRALSRDSRGAIRRLPVISDFLPIRPGDVLQSEDKNKIIAGYKALVISHDILAKKAYGGDSEQPLKKHDGKIDRPLTTRPRRTLLTIIAALCKYEGLDTNGRGTAQRIKEMTEDLGAPIDDGTIAKMLSEIPDALETRMK